MVLCFIGFVLTVAFLLVHQNGLQQSGSADGRVPASLLKNQLLVAGAAGTAALLLAAALAVPLRMMGRGLSLRQVLDQLSLPPSALNPGRLASVRRAGLQFDNREEFRVGLGAVEDRPDARLPGPLARRRTTGADERSDCTLQEAGRTRRSEARASMPTKWRPPE